MNLSLDLFAENILDYYRNPRNKGAMVSPHAQARGSNPLCGDVVSFQLEISGGKISKALFNGSGCAISQASASMLAQKAEGMTPEQVGKLGKDDVFSLLGVEVEGSRAKCALLPLSVLQKAASESKL